VTLGSKNLITALRNILSKLELTGAPGDEASFLELKRILKQRIQNLENRASMPANFPCVVKTARKAD